MLKETPQTEKILHLLSCEGPVYLLDEEFLRDLRLPAVLVCMAPRCSWSRQLGQIERRIERSDEEAT